MSSLYQDTGKLKRHFELQWQSKLILTKSTLDGTEQEKQKIIDERIKKFHLYNTPQLASHLQNQSQFQESILKSHVEDQTINFEAYDKSLILYGAKHKDINYLGLLFKQNQAHVKKVVPLPENKGLQLYFKDPFDNVYKCLCKVDNPPNGQKGCQIYQLKKIPGKFEMFSPDIRCTVVMEAKPGSRQYLFDHAKSKFLQKEIAKIQSERTQRNRSRSRSRSSSIGSERKTVNLHQNAEDNPFNKRKRFLFKKQGDHRQRMEEEDIDIHHARRSLHFEAIHDKSKVRSGPLDYKI